MQDILFDFEAEYLKDGDLIHMIEYYVWFTS